MIVLDQDFGELPCIWDRFFADAVLNEGFLEQGVSAIFFIGEDGAQVAGGPVCGSNGVPEPAGHQRQTDIPDAFSGKVPFKNLADSFCFLRNDHRIPVGPFFIAQQGFVLEGDFAVFDGLALAPADISGDGFALGLREGGVERDEEFTFRVDGVDVLLLEDHGDAKAPQLTGNGHSFPEWHRRGRRGWGKRKNENMGEVVSDYLCDVWQSTSQQIVGKSCGQLAHK